MIFFIITDFEKTFIQAVVCRYADLKELGDEPAVKAAGKLQTKGKEYVMEDGDMYGSPPPIFHLKKSANMTSFVASFSKPGLRRVEPILFLVSSALG